MNTAPSISSSTVASKKKLALTANEPSSAVGLAITAHVASLKLPPFPKKIIGAARMSPTDLRCKAALAVYAALPELDHAIVPSIANASKLSVKDALIACKDLVASGLVTSRVDGAEFTVYATRKAS